MLNSLHLKQLICDDDDDNNNNDNKKQHPALVHIKGRRLRQYNTGLIIMRWKYFTNVGCGFVL